MAASLRRDALVLTNSADTILNTIVQYKSILFYNYHMCRFSGRTMVNHTAGTAYQRYHPTGRRPVEVFVPLGALSANR